MRIARRALLKASALLAGGLPLAGCDGIISGIAGRLGQTIPERLCAPDSEKVDADFNLLSRAGFGPWPGDLERLKEMGAAAWIEEQLKPDSIDDGLCNLRSRRFESLHFQPGDCYDVKKEVLRADITRHTLLKAMYSKRQLFEVMVEFWTDHLNINLEKGDCIYLKPHDDMKVIRPHALGRFRDLIKASAISPAMLAYLDGKENKRTCPRDVPNENYARELLELHTLGVDGGYTQKDVFEAARCLTGWRVKDEWSKGVVYFDESRHDNGRKVVLGQVIEAGGGGERDLNRLLDIACSHPSTASHIARKLVALFVADQPPVSLTDAVSREFISTDGDITQCVRTILLSPEFHQQRQVKFKRPFRFVVSAMRALGADSHARAEVVEYLNRMGQSPFQYPTPDGYPVEMLPWLGTLLWRWNFAFELCSNKIPSVNVALPELESAIAKGAGKSKDATELVARYLLGKRMSSSELRILQEQRTGLAVKGNELSILFGMVMASPSFQEY